jgi:hypothetical protein
MQEHLRPNRLHSACHCAWPRSMAASEFNGRLLAPPNACDRAIDQAQSVGEQEVKADTIAGIMKEVIRDKT